VWSGVDGSAEDGLVGDGAVDDRDGSPVLAGVSSVQAPRRRAVRVKRTAPAVCCVFMV
jgi:hypothetical protein